MGFMTNNAGNNNNQAAGNTGNNWEKAAGFLNLYLPTQEGKRRKLGAIPLRVGNVNEKKLLEWLNEDPTRVGIILSKLIAEYVSAEPAEGSSFDLSDPVQAPAAGATLP